ncbi:MAG TPA: glycosyltransferase [Caldilineaceae bacterium]|nr:glycosyltransferase [Caldilineaceae bacterium]
MVNEYYPPFTPGGAERSTQLLAGGLARHPDVARVVVITPNYGASAREELDGALVERYAFPVKLAGQRRIAPYGFLANPLYYAYSAWQIARHIRKHQLDIVHAHNKQSIVGTVFAARWTGVPAVVTLRDLLVLCRYGLCINDFNTRPQGCDLASYVRCLRDFLALYMPDAGAARRSLIWLMAGYHRLDSLLKRSMLKRADTVITISQRLREIYVSRGINPKRLVVLYNPLPEKIPARAPDRREGCYRLLYAGKLSWGKGPHLLIEAMPAVRAALAPQPVSLTVAGEGPLRLHLEQRVAELGLGDAVEFLGQLPQREMLRRYGEVDLVVVPSVWQEGFGRVALEALSAGTPVVVSNHGGLAEIVEDGVTGYVVEPEVESIAAATVAALRENPTLRRQVAEAQPRLHAKFGADVIERHLEVYRTLLASSARGSH